MRQRDSPSFSLRPAGGAGLPKQRPRRLHDGVLRLPAGRGRPRADRSAAVQEGELAKKLRNEG